MDVDVIITDDDTMTINNNKKRGIKDKAIVALIVLIIFLIITVIKSDEIKFVGWFMILEIAVFAFVFILFLIDYFFQCKVFIEVSDERLLLRKYGKKTIKICSGDIIEINFREVDSSGNDPVYYMLILKYGKHKKYKLPLSGPLEIGKIEKFFIQYCNKRNIMVKNG